MRRAKSGLAPFNEWASVFVSFSASSVFFYGDAFREIFLRAIEETAASSLHTNHLCQSYLEPLP